MKSDARAVIIGGGISGCSLAYHLALKGWTDVVLLEKDILTSGATSYAAGLVTQFHASPTMMKARAASIRLYRELAREEGEAAGWNEVGSVRVASSETQLMTLHRKVSQARALGMDVQIISPEETLQLHPYISAEHLYGAIHIPEDGHLEPCSMTMLLARRARELGVTIETGARVTAIERAPDGAVEAVVTEAGRIRTPIVVNAAGMWAPRVAEMVGALMPMTPVKHQYVITAPVEGSEVPRDTPVLRDPDNLVYIREEVGGFLVGGFETDPAAWHAEGVPWEHSQTALPSDWEQFDEVLAGAMRRVPMLEQAEAIKLINHPDAMTPDGEPCVGPVPGAPGFWACAGLSLNGFGGGGGLGQYLAEWIVDGRPSIDLNQMDVRRFGAVHADSDLVCERAREAYKYYYYPRYPHDEWEWGRPKRKSPVHSRTSAAGAVYGQKNGWERVNHFRSGEESRRAGADQRRGWGWGRPEFFEAVGEEHRAVRERVGLFDLSSFGKLDVSGPDALALLQRLAGGDVDRPVGRLVYTQMFNPTGGIESDLTIVRRGEQSFRLICGSAFVYSDLGWLLQHLPVGASVDVRDVTEDFACLALWGPRAREVLARVSPDDLSNEAFPYLTARDIEAAGVPVWAQRVSYVGELGWELYVAPEGAVRVWDALMEAGVDAGIRPAGYRSIDSLRLEKGYRYWGADITAADNPYEAGLGFCVRLAKEDFIGREALVRLKEDPGPRRLCTLLTGGEPWSVYGGESVCLDGEVVGRVTSAGYGYTVESNIALAYLPVELAREETSLQLDLFGQLLEARVAPDALLDPKGERLRS